jgi:hypothetical protein
MIRQSMSRIITSILESCQEGRSTVGPVPETRKGAVASRILRETVVAHYGWTLSSAPTAP